MNHCLVCGCVFAFEKTRLLKQARRAGNFDQVHRVDDADAAAGGEPLIACAYCRFGFIRVSSSTNQACRCLIAASAYFCHSLIRQALVSAAT